MTTLHEIRAHLQTHKNKQRMEHWKKNGNSSWSSYGIAVTKLKEIAKQIPSSRWLAIQLWQQPNYDLKILSFLIDNPKEIPLEETKRMVLQLRFLPISKVYLHYVFSKLPQAMELAAVYRSSPKALERRCGYGYLPYAVKNKKIPDAYFIPIINTIEARLTSEDRLVKEAMTTALYAMGKRSETLGERCMHALLVWA